jgi:hypothetical protein
LRIPGNLTNIINTGKLMGNSSNFLQMIIAGHLKSPSDGKSGAISPEIRDAVKQILKLPILRSKPF